MKIRKPDYYNRFQCIAGACSDSCCIGWEIDIDEDRREEYRKVSGALGERMKRCIDWEEGHFILQGKEERCPFLNQENLCDLIIELGEGALCEICREHPRYYEWYDGLTEVGVGLCCEAAARLILESETPAGFVLEDEMETDHEGSVLNGEEEDEAESDTDEEEFLAVLMEARETAYQILQNRKFSIWERMSQFAAYIDEIQDGLDFGNQDEIRESASYYREEMSEKVCMEVDGMRVIEICRELEAIDGSWPKTLDRLEALLRDVSRFTEVERKMNEMYVDRDYEYEHLAVYFVYRYFMKCRMDGDIYSKGMLMVFCIQLIHLLDVLTFSEKGELTMEDRVQNAKNCSKEIEYSEDNLDMLAEMLYNF